MKDILKNKHLVCIDSDGCAIDSMTIKHERAFGPAFTEIWNVPADEELHILYEWNAINLYTITRGINRFQGLVTILELHPEYVNKEQWKSLKLWTETTKALSPDSLRAEYDRSQLEIMAKALAWSDKVNEIIGQLPLATPFEGVLETIEHIKSKADIAVVSSANPVAIEEEWKQSGLYERVDHFFSQADGTKSECIKKLITLGYDPEKIIMMGDAVGDYQAAMNNQVGFYPILAAKEATSWFEFNHTYFQVFLKGEFNKDVQDRLLVKMNKNLSPKQA